MAPTYTNTNNNWIFQEFLFLLGGLVHSNLMKQIDYLKVENRILRSKISKRIRLTDSEKRRLIKYGLALGGDIRNLISVVCYTTFRSWVSKGIHPCQSRSIGGRKRKSQEVRALILRLAKENAWGYTRILGELNKLGVESISRNTVKNILKENGLDPMPQRNKDTWDSFMKRHFKTLWACDFFTKTVWTLLGPKTFHALFFINIHTRKVHIAGITRHPNRQWVVEKTKKISFLFEGGSESSKLLIRDGDTKYTKEFDEILKRYGFTVKKIPYKSPNLNPYAEGWVGSIKRECLDKFYIFGERHFRYLVNEYVKYYNTVRPHSSLNNMPLEYKPIKKNGRIKCEKRLGGIIKHYYRE